MKKFKHSGTFGDLIYSLPIVKYFGGGEFYLHLDQINWIGQYYYNSKPNPVHQGRMNYKDFEFMKRFMQQLDYIDKFEILDQKTTEITHNLDRFRKLFVGHPGNYIDVYATSFNLTDEEVKKKLRTSPWLTTKNIKTFPGKDIIINRTTRWLPTKLSSKWLEWKNQGLDQSSIFIGLPEEYQNFKDTIGWNIPFYQCTDMLDMAEVINGSKLFIGNQSAALSLAVGLGKEYWVELRQDLPLDRNECNFHDNPNAHNF